MTIKQMTEPVSRTLGNTPAITRKSYIHPAVIDLCNQQPDDLSDQLTLPRKTKWLSGAERGLIGFLAQN